MARLALLLVFSVAIISINAQSYMDRIVPRRNICRAQGDYFNSWSNYNYVTPGAPSYDSGSIKHSLRTINNNRVYQAEIYKASSTIQSAWGLLDFSASPQGKFSTPAYIDFYFLRDNFNVPSNGFASIASFSPDGGNAKRYVTVDINAQNMIYLNNVPSQNSGAQWLYQRTNNVQSNNVWMNITVYVDFNPAGGIMAVWQDGVIQSVANIQGSSSATLGQLHLGLVASGSISSGSIYNYGLNIMQVCGQASPPTTTTTVPVPTTTQAPPSTTTSAPTTTRAPPATTTTAAPTTTVSPSTTTTRPNCWTCASGWVHWWQTTLTSPPNGDACGCVRVDSVTTNAPSPTTTRAPSSPTTTINVPSSPTTTVAPTTTVLPQPSVSNSLAPLPTTTSAQVATPQGTNVVRSDSVRQTVSLWLVAIVIVHVAVQIL
ncbi:envelope glycoprotein [Acrasis kona]|uniref:Envelope glycoprotein n=1 Tax=Acrasis kona TaxID=1008807 RepID=A0AAW2Z067_9EUKA